MKLVIQEYVNVVGNIEESNIVRLTINEFDVGNSILSLVTAKGQMLVSTAAGALTTLTGLDGQTPIWDAASPGGMKAGTPASGAGEKLTNRNGSALATGSVVILKTGYDSSVTTTTTDQDPRIHGVAGESIADLAEGNIITKGAKATVLVTGTVGRYEWLVPSTTAGRARGAGYTRPPYGAIGIALEANPSGNAAIQASIDCHLYISDSAGKGYAFGNYATSTLVQRLNFITEVSVGSTALPGNKSICAGLAGSTNAFVLGDNITAYKVPYATDTPSAVAAANLPDNLIYVASTGFADATKGFIAGGYISANTAKAYKVIFATETTTAVAGANLSTARYSPCHITDTNNGYTLGGFVAAVSAIADKTSFSAETTAAVTSANLSTARYGTASISKPGSHGLITGGFTTAKVANVDKITFASDTTTASTGLASAIAMAGGMSALNNGYKAGGSNGLADATGIATTVEKVPFATNVFAVASGAALPASQTNCGAASTLN